MKTIVAAIILIVLLLLLYFLFRPFRESFRKNTHKTTRVLIGVIFAVAVIAIVAALILRMRQDGGGLLFTDRNALIEADREKEKNDGSVISIRIRGNEVSIGGETVRNDTELSEKLTKLVNEGKSFRLVDTYAAAETYLRTRELLISLGAGGSRLTEETED